MRSTIITPPIATRPSKRGVQLDGAGRKLSTTKKVRAGPDRGARQDAVAVRKQAENEGVRSAAHGRQMVEGSSPGS
jgi:hypothetical protein